MMRHAENFTSVRNLDKSLFSKNKTENARFVFALFLDLVISSFLVFVPHKKHINKTMWQTGKFHQKMYHFRMDKHHKDFSHGPFKQFQSVIIPLLISYFQTENNRGRQMRNRVRLANTKSQEILNIQK